jgi:hypothetical protein
MLEKFSNEIIQKAINEFNKEDNQAKLKTNIIDPIVYYILDRLSPYILVASSVFILTFLIAVVILFMMIRNSYGGK